ncbi:DUF4253 domain-containing protein [Streptomyces sp. 7R007]
MATLPNPLPRLAADPSGHSVGLRLPPGRLIDATVGPRSTAVLWQADQQASVGTWAALGRPAVRAGLLPVLVDAEHGEFGPQSWGLAPEDMSYPGDHDAEDVLEEYWQEYAAEDEEWPGLADAPALVADPDTRAAEVADSLTGGRPWFKWPHLALVPARRSADIPTAVGWTAPAHYEQDVARLSAVLRSWEDRFGIRVVGLGRDHLFLSVAAPPADAAEAEAVAAEHFAFCPYSVLQRTDDTLTPYAQALVGEREWSFWWD